MLTIFLTNYSRYPDNSPRSRYYIYVGILDVQLFCSARRPSRHDTPPPSHITSHFVRGLSSLICRSVYCSAEVVVSIKLSRMVIVLHPTFPHSRFVRNSAFWAEAKSDLHLPPPPPSSALRHIPEASNSLWCPHTLGAGRRKLLLYLYLYLYLYLCLLL